MKSPIRQRVNQRRERVSRFLEHSQYSGNFDLPIAARIVLGLIGLIVIGTLLLMLPGIGKGERLTFAEAVFTATSALTVTGLSVITPAIDLTLTGKVLLLILIQIGGVGFMFVAVVALRLIGRRIYIKDRLTLTSSLGLSSPAEILGLLRRVFWTIIGIEFGAGLLLGVHWMRYFPAPQSFAYGLFHAISAFCNAGFDLFNGEIDKTGEGFSGIPSDTLSLAILGGLILVGGLGIPVLGELFSRRRPHHYTLNTRVTLWVVLGLMLFGWVGLFIAEYSGVLEGLPLDERLVRTLFQSISNRTAGFAGLPQFDMLSPASILLIIAMMFVGCAPASMGGGITTGTFSVLLIALRSYARGDEKARIGRRSLEINTVRRAGAILTISLALLFISTWLILITHPHFTLAQAFFEVVSAFATCGLSVGATGGLNWFGRIVIMAMMFWGRLGPLTLVVALSQRRDRASQLVKFPEEQILIG